MRLIVRLDNYIRTSGVIFYFNRFLSLWFVDATKKKLCLNESNEISATEISSNIL